MRKSKRSRFRSLLSFQSLPISQLLASLACATSWLRRRSRKPLRLLLFRVDVKVDVEEIKAPELAPRKNQIFEEGDIDAFVAAVAEALK